MEEEAYHILLMEMWRETSLENRYEVSLKVETYSNQVSNWSNLKYYPRETTNVYIKIFTSEIKGDWY